MKNFVTILISSVLLSFVLAGCGGGGGSGQGAKKGVVYSTYDSSSVTIAILDGSNLTIGHVNATDNEVYIGSATVDTNGNFTIPNIVKYGTNTKVASATGTGGASTATVTITPVGGTPFTMTLNLDTAAYSGIYVGNYSGSSSGEFVTGVSGNTIRGYSVVLQMVGLLIVQP